MRTGNRVRRCYVGMVVLVCCAKGNNRKLFCVFRISLELTVPLTGILFEKDGNKVEKKNGHSLPSLS